MEKRLEGKGGMKVRGSTLADGGIGSGRLGLGLFPIDVPGVRSQLLAPDTGGGWTDPAGSPFRAGRRTRFPGSACIPSSCAGRILRRYSSPRTQLPCATEIPGRTVRPWGNPESPDTPRSRVHPPTQTLSVSCGLASFSPIPMSACAPRPRHLWPSNRIYRVLHQDCALHHPLFPLHHLYSRPPGLQAFMPSPPTGGSACR